MSDKTLGELEKEAQINDLRQEVMTLTRFVRSMVDDDQEDSFLFQMSVEWLSHRLIRIDELIKGVSK
jgi:hypothetical protein